MATVITSTAKADLDENHVEFSVFTSEKANIKKTSISCSSEVVDHFMTGLSHFAANDRSML